MRCKDAVTRLAVAAMEKTRREKKTMLVKDRWSRLRVTRTESKEWTYGRMLPYHGNINE